MLRNNLIILTLKREILDKTNNKDIIEIESREKNTYFNKIVGYNEKMDIMKKYINTNSSN
jgi:hypothetical protein